MTTFRGLLEVEGDPESVVITDVEIVQGTITLTASGSTLGAWRLNDISIVPGEDHFRIEAENEALLLRVRDAKRFAAAVGVGAPDSEPRGLEVLFPEHLRSPQPYPPAPDHDLEPPPSPPPVPAPAEAEPRRGPDDTPLARPLAWALAATAVVLLAGGFLDWGPWGLVSGRFPVEQLLAVLAAFAAGASAYLAMAGEKRRDVALVATLSAVIVVIVVVLYAIKAGIGPGFVITILGGTAVATLALVAMTPLGAGPVEAPDDAD